MFTKSRIENQNSWFSSHALAAALVALLLVTCAASGFAEEPQPKAFAIGDAAVSGPAIEKGLAPEAKNCAPEIASGKRHRAEASQANQPSKEDWIRCLQSDACHAQILFTDEWDRVFGSPVDVFSW